MERRREQRKRVEQDVRLWILAETETEHPAHLEEFSGIGARLRTPAPIPIGAAVRIEWDDSMYLGECVHCAVLEDGGHVAGVHFEQVLESFGDLKRMMESLMAGGESCEPSSPVRTEPSRRSHSRG